MWRCGGDTGPTCQTENRTMNLKHNLLLVHRSRHVLGSLWEMSSQCWPGSAWGGAFPANRDWLRRFLLLKLVTVLLLPQGLGLPLLVGCVFSLRALLLLGSPRISTKPSTVLLAQLALTDGLVLLSWGLRLGAALGGWGVEGGQADTVSLICEQLLDAHHLASLLLLGLLGLEAMLVSRWPQQTRTFRTSHLALLSCRLVWILVLLELASLLHLKLLQDSRQQVYLSTLPALSVCSRRMLWLMDSWLHYAIFIRKPLKRQSSFH